MTRQLARIGLKWTYSSGASDYYEEISHWRLNMPKVLNKYKDGVPAGAVYIGRPSKWGNPFVIGKDGDRDEVIAKYRQWLLAQPTLVEAAKRELAGKDLVCF